jgi:Cu/Zn superoxide dismutase
LTLTTLPDNPHGKTHGAPADEERHVGDLGNFKTDAEGNSVGTVQDKLIKLFGAESILGVRFPLITTRERRLERGANSF